MIHIVRKCTLPTHPTNYIFTKSSTKSFCTTQISVRRELDNAAKDLKLSHLNDWYNVTPKSYEDLLGSLFAKEFNSSPHQLLSSAYPEHEWLAWKFQHYKSPPSFWTEIRNQRQFLEYAAKELKIKEMSDWYKVSNKDLIALGGSPLLSLFKFTLYKLLNNVYAEVKWDPWKFEKSMQPDVKDPRKFMDWVGKELGLKEMSDWYKVTNEELTVLGGGPVLAIHDSVYNLLSSIYPEYPWIPWNFESAPKKTLLNSSKDFMDMVAMELKIKDINDWYNISAEEIRRFKGGDRILRVHNNSIYKLLNHVFPEHKWLPWKFSHTIVYWSNPSTWKSFLEYAAKELNVKEMSDWYRVVNKDLVALGGNPALTQHGSLYKLLSTVYPEYEWLPWKFDNSVKKTNVKEFIDAFSAKHNINSLSDWYKVSKEEIRKFEGGDRILRAYNNSLVKLLSSVYTEQEWLPWKFVQSKAFWSNSDNWRSFMEFAAKELNIKDMNDWYKVKAEQLIDLGGGILFVKNHSLPQLLSSVYSDFKWEMNKFSQNVDIWNDEHLSNYFVEWLKKQPEYTILVVQQIIFDMDTKGLFPLTHILKVSFPKYKWISSLSTSGKKTQYILKDCIEKLFVADKEVLLLQEYRHPDISNLELDYFLPQYNLAFEYQGKQHYRNVNVFHQKESIDTSKERDKQKSEICKEIGITLIEVPYWWDRKISSLAATVYNNRPDLFDIHPEGTPIPLSPPSEESTSTKSSKEFLMTATEWDNSSMEPKGWFMTEKYDGMRLYWNGTQFISRQGRKVQVPESITKQLPVVALDGELWTQYGLYQEAVNLGRTTDEAKWKKAIFWIFDSPQLENKSMEERIEFLKDLNLPPWAKVVEFVKCEGKEHLKQFNDAIIAKGGEGVILREPGSLYKPGRSTGLRRHKSFFDTEVKVTESQYPHGFTCEQMNGKTIFVNIPNEMHEEAKQIKSGSVITVKHSGMNVHGTLLYPQFYRERLDVKWNDLLNKSL